MAYDDVYKLVQQQLAQAQEQIKNLSGDLQTANRAEVQSRKRTEVEKFKGTLKEQEYKSKTQNQISLDKLDNAVKLSSEKLRLATDSQIRSDAQKNAKK